MRVAHYAPDLWSNGGVATYVRRLATEQATRGHTVLLLSQTPPLADAATTRPPVPHVEVIGDEHAYDIAIAHRCDLLHLHKPVHTRPSLPALRTMHDNTAACPSGTRYLARTGTPCARTASLPACLWGHAVDGCGSRRPHRIFDDVQRLRAEWEVLSTIPVVAVSNYVKQEMVRAGFAADAITVVPSPAPARRQPLPPSTAVRPRFLFMARIVPEKGLSWLLRAVAETDVPLHLDVAGDGHALRAARALCDDLRISDCVTFHGWLPPSEIETLLTEARAVVVPSVWQEPAGLVTLEAAAAGRAVIASRVGGIPEYALPDFSLLAAPNDVPGLSAHLARLAGDACLAAQMGRAGLTCAHEQFREDRFMDAIDTEYKRVMATVARQSPDVPVLSSQQRSPSL